MVNNMLEFEDFCVAVHQDVGVDFGEIEERVIFGVAWDFQDEHLEAVLRFLEYMMESKQLDKVVKIAEENACWRIISRETALEDVKRLCAVIQKMISCRPSNPKELNDFLDRNWPE